MCVFFSAFSVSTQGVARSIIASVRRMVDRADSRPLFETGNAQVRTQIPAAKILKRKRLVLLAFSTKFPDLMVEVMSGQ